MPKTPYELILEQSSPATSTPYDTISNELYDMSPYQNFLADAYGYPESSLGVGYPNYKNLSMGEEELKQQQGVGFFNSLFGGLSSGATLGWVNRFVERPDREAMTFAEEAVEFGGELVGGLLPFGIASAVIGTVGAPIAAGGAVMAGVYNAISKIGKSERIIKRLSSTLKQLEGQRKILGEGFDVLGGGKQINIVKERMKKVIAARRDNINIVRDAQRQYMKDLSEKGTKSSLRELKRLAKIKTKEGIIYPRIGGALLPKSKTFQKIIKGDLGTWKRRAKEAKSKIGKYNLNKETKSIAEKYGYKGVQVLNKFVNNIGTFAAVGLVADTGKDFADRLKEVPKDALMGTLFAVSGLPSIYGKRGATVVEPASLMALGSYSDYLTGRPNPDMSPRDRLLHGLGLVALHEVGQRASNWGAKEKMFRGLVESGAMDTEVALKTVYGTNASNAIISGSRNIWQKRGTLFFNKDKPSDVISVVGWTGAEKVKPKKVKAKDKQVVEEVSPEKQATITYRNLDGEKFTIEGRTLTEATQKLLKKYARVDFKNKDLIDDLPPESRENADAVMENLKTDVKILDGISISRAGVETKGKHIKQLKSEEEIIFGEGGFAAKEKIKPSEQKKTFKNKQIRALKRIIDKIRFYDIKKLKDTDAPRKGYIVRWVKDGVDQLTRKDDGEPTSVKLTKVEGDYAYFKEDPNITKKTKTTHNRIPLEEVEVAKKPWAKPRYQLKLQYKGKEGGRTQGFESRNWSDPKELIFNSEKEALEYAEKHWVKGSIDSKSNESIDYKIKRLKDEVSSIKYTKEYESWNKSISKFDKAAKDYGLSKKEKEVVIFTVYPHSFGKINELTIREVNRLVDTLRGDEYVTQDVYQSRVPLPPENIVTKLIPSSAKLFSILSNASESTRLWANRLAFPTESIVSSIPGGWRAGLAMLRHGWWRQSIVGTGIRFQKNLAAMFKPYKLKGGMGYINKHIQAFLDTEVFGVLQKTPKYQKFADKMNSFKIEEYDPKTDKMVEYTGLEYAVKEYHRFYDELGKALISSGSWVRDAKNKQFKRKPFIELYDNTTAHNRIELIDVHNTDLHDVVMSRKVTVKTPVGEVERTITETVQLPAAELHEMQVESFLKYAKGDIEKVYNEHGRQVFVNKKLSNHFYVKNYSRRQITNEFFDFISSSNDSILEAANYMAKNDKMFKDLNLTLEQKRNKAREYIRMLQKINSQENISGQQYTRVADLPSYFYISRAPGNIGDIIRIRKGKEFKESGEPYKAGDKIVDEFGNVRTIANAVKVYETDYSKVLDRYATNIAHSTATYHAYPGRYAQTAIDTHKDNIMLMSGDKWTAEYAEKMLKLQVFGEKSSPLTKGLQVISSFAAKAGLSFPTSGLKNTMLGNKETVTVFTSQELFEAYFSRDNGLLNPMGGFTRKWKTELDWARDLGTTHAGAYELFMEPGTRSGFLKRYISNAGGMVTTEIGNRTISQAVGGHALNIHIKNMANYKVPSTEKISPETSRRILMDVFRFTPDEISSMVDRYRTSSKNGYDNMQYTSKEIAQARQQAHIITQGSGELPYVPLWLGTGWAKPLSLFYRVAYRMTESVAKHVVKPVITEGNLVPAMTYMTGTLASGWTMFQVYHWLFDEERVNKFKSMPSNVFDYFLKAEGLALFSNAFNEFGGPLDSYWPVPARHAETTWDNIVAYTTGKKTGEQALGDGLREVVAAYNGYERVIQRLTGDTTKKVRESKRRQRQFDDAFYPKEKINIDFDDGITTKTPYYRALRDVFWDDDEERRAINYYAALAWVRDRVAEEKGVNHTMSEKEAMKRIKGILTRMRPVPYSWRKRLGRTGKSKYLEYLSKISEEDRQKEKMLDDLYVQKLGEFYQIIHKYKDKYYKKG